MKGADPTRDFYEAWFIAYKVAQKFRCLDKQIRSQREMYAAWGDVRGLGFDRWWRRKHQLFTPSEKGQLVAGTLAISVPVGQRIGPLLRDVRRLVGPKLFRKRDSTVLRDSLLYYVGYYLPWSKVGAPRTGKSQVPHVKAYFEKIGRKPPVFLSGNGDAARRSLNRCVHRAESAIVAIAAGTFPKAPRDAKRLWRQMEMELLEERVNRNPLFAGFYVSYRTPIRKSHLRKVFGPKLAGC